MNRKYRIKEEKRIFPNCPDKNFSFFYAQYKMKYFPLIWITFNELPWYSKKSVEEFIRAQIAREREKINRINYSKNVYHDFTY